MPEEISPGGLVQLGLGFWGPKTLLSAVELGVFTELAGKSLTAAELTQTFGWHTRAAATFLDALVALGILKRDRAGRYRNSRAASLFLDRNQVGADGAQQVIDEGMHR